MRLYLGGAPCCDAFARLDGLDGPEARKKWARLQPLDPHRHVRGRLTEIEVHVIRGWQYGVGMTNVFALSGFWSWLQAYERAGYLKIVERCETELPDWDHPPRDLQPSKNPYRKHDGWEEYDRQQRIARWRYEGKYPHRQEPTQLYQSKQGRRRLGYLG